MNEITKYNENSRDLFHSSCHFSKSQSHLTGLTNRIRRIRPIRGQETRMFRNKLNMNNLRLSIVDVSPKSYEVRFLRIAKTQIAAKDEDQQNMDCGLYWNWQIQQRRHLSASLILTTLAR